DSRIARRIDVTALRRSACQRPRDTVSAMGAAQRACSSRACRDHARSHLRATTACAAPGEPTSSSISRLAVATAAWRSVGASAGSFGGTLGAQLFQAAAVSLSNFSRGGHPAELLRDLGRADRSAVLREEAMDLTRLTLAGCAARSACQS